MSNPEPAKSPQPSDAPQRIRAVAVAKRLDITPRLAGEWIRAMVAAGVLKKIRAVSVGRWSAIDAWVESGGAVTHKRTVRAGGVR